MAVKGEQYGVSQQRNHLAYTWVLKDFSKLVSQYRKPGRNIRSKVFEPEKESVAQLYISLYPGGESEDVDEYVSVFVKADCGVRKVRFDFEDEVVYEKLTLTLKASSGKVIRRRFFFLENTDIDSGWGFPEFIIRDLLLEKLRDDVLVVFLEMTYSLTIVRKRSGAVKNVLVPSPDFAVSQDFWLAMKSGKHSDVQIQVEGIEIPAHRFVLAARSKVFSAMFDEDLLENGTEDVIYVIDFDAHVVRSMLYFMYIGTVRNLNTNLALELLRAADEYEISGLKSLCSNFLMSHMDEENVFKVLIAAYTNDAVELFIEAIDYVCDKSHVVDFAKCDSMLVDHPKLFALILAEMRKKL